MITKMELAGPEDYPEHGHMVVLAPDHTAVYWLADRHARLEPPVDEGRITLVGAGRRLLEAPAEEGIIDFTSVREYDGPALNPATRAGDAYCVLLDPDAIEPVKFPPYIPDACARPQLADLVSPTAPFWGNQLAIHDAGDGPVLFWLWWHPYTEPILYGAPVLPNRTVDWAATEAREDSGLPEPMIERLLDYTGRPWLMV